VNAADDKSLMLQAALDGELDARAMLDFERACAENPELGAEYVRLTDLDALLRRHVAIEPASKALRDRIDALTAPVQQPKSRFAPSYRALAASLAVFCLAGLGALTLQPRPNPSDIQAEALVSAFIRAQIAGQPVDVASSDRHTVKPWLAGRAPLAVSAVDLAASGFPLAGGRVEVVDRHVAPTLVYKRREHRIDVSELPLTGADATLRFSSLEGYHLARWSDADRSYLAVTDLPQSELADFVALFRAAGAVEREEPKK